MAKLSLLAKSPNWWSLSWRNFPAFFWHSDVCKQEAGQLGHNHIHPAAICQYLIYSYMIPIASQHFPIFAARRVQIFPVLVQIRAMIWIQSICHKREPSLPFFLEEEMMIVLVAAIKNTSNPHLATKPHLYRENAGNDNCTLVDFPR